MTQYNKDAVNKSIEAANRASGRPTSVAEARQIHRLLQGRRSPRLAPGSATDHPDDVPGGEVAGMSRERFLASLAKFGHTASTAHHLIGMGRSTIYRMANGTSEVPAVVMRLLDMYERFGVPNEHRTR